MIKRVEQLQSKCRKEPIAVIEVKRGGCGNGGPTDDNGRRRRRRRRGAEEGGGGGGGEGECANSQIEKSTGERGRPVKVKSDDFDCAKSDNVIVYLFRACRVNCEERPDFGPRLQGLIQAVVLTREKVKGHV
jgi:hypothetical protein